MTTARAAVRAVLIVIPARDEEDRIGRCLRSVIAASNAARDALDVETRIVVVADRCSDRTVHLATETLEGHGGEVLSADWGEVGSARRVGVVAGLAHVLHHPTEVWIANTDADCEVPEDWLITQLAHAERGADAVLGIVSVDHFDEHDPGAEATFIDRYHLHADGSHDHVHGANLGVRADRYIDAGGWARVAHSEDHALCRALEGVGATIVRTIELTVVTSGRRQGRAPSGFAQTLCSLGESA
jgi:glycosyltransferase involved in cell wall biosynthesis